MRAYLVNTTLAADLVGGGTITVSYPAGTQKGTFSGSLQHKFASGAGQGNNIFLAPRDFTLTFNASNITVNWTSGSPTIPAGTPCVLQLAQPGKNADRALTPFPNVPNMVRAGVFTIELGSMASASATNIINASAVAGAGVVALTGTVNAQGQWAADQPRNLQYKSSNAGDTTQTVTTKGFDTYNVAMTETVTLNGTSVVAGAKAFARVASVTASAALAGNLSVGSNTAMGLPFYLYSAGNVLKEIVDGSVVTNGTFTVGSTSKPSATTGDVRGTYVPNTASDGTHSYELIVALEDPDFLGSAQF